MESNDQRIEELKAVIEALKMKAPDIGEFDVEIKVSELESLKADLAHVTAERDEARVVAENLLEDIAWITSDKPCPKCGAGVSCRCWGCVAKKAEAERDEARAEVERLRKILGGLRDWFEGWQDFHMSQKWIAKIDAALAGPGKEAKP